MNPGHRHRRERRVQTNKPGLDTFPSIQSSGAWEYVRQADNYQSNGFVGDVSTPQMRCFQTAGSASKATYTVAAGSAVTYNAAPNVYHPGPMAFYLAKVPAGETIDTFDGAGEVWFKIYHEQPNFGAQLTWPSNGMFSSTGIFSFFLS